MSIVIDANMKLFADRINITSTRMIREYGLSTVEEIIESEAEKGNTKALQYAKEFSNSPEKLIKLFELTDVENKFVILNKMDSATQEKVLPLLLQEDLVMGLHFFTQEKLLEMLMNIDIEELVKVATEAFSIEQIVMMYTEEDLAAFMQHDDLEKHAVLEQLKAMPPEILIKFIEGITGKAFNNVNLNEFLKSLEEMPDDKFKKFMSEIDPEFQRQLTFQLVKQDPKYLNLFENFSYVSMLSTLLKPDMIKPMIRLNKETLVTMIAELPGELKAIVASQVDPKEFAKFLQDGHMDLIKEALII